MTKTTTCSGRTRLPRAKRANGIAKLETSAANRPIKPCPKCGNAEFGFWTSSSSGARNWYCKACQAGRRVRYKQRKKENGGSHTPSEWRALLSQTPSCPECMLPWKDIPSRPSRRYKYKWTKDHIIPLLHKGSDAIFNIRPLCWKCNFKKGANKKAATGRIQAVNNFLWKLSERLVARAGHE